MSEKGNFAGGFLAGAILGGVVGGVVGAILASRQTEQLEDTAPELNGESQRESNSRRFSRRRMASEERIEAARRSLEGKIAQLNTAIDDVRQQLETNNGNETTDLPSESSPPY